MSRGLILISFALTFIIAGCGDSACYTKLEEIDSLTENDFTDSACEIMKTVESTYNIKEGKEKAYYNLLKYQLLFRKQDSGSYSINDSIIDYSISYYSKYTDNRKLALCYYLKGRMSGNNKDIIKCLKQAEFIAKNTNNNFLKMRICISISNVNLREENYATALEYGHKALKYGKLIKDKEVFASCLLTLSSIYGYIGNSDSAIYYAEKSLPLTPYMNKKLEAGLYINIAAHAEKTDTAKARKYAWKAINTAPTNTAYQILAKLARDKKEYELSELYLNEALKYSKSVDWEASILHELAQTKELMGKYKEAREISKKVIELQDSVEHIKARDSIKEIQMAAELENANISVIKEKDNKTLTIIVSQTLVIAIICTTYAIKRRKHKDSVETLEKEKEEYKQGIKKIEEEKEKEIEEKKKEIETIQKRQAKVTKKQLQEANEQYQEGFHIYDKVKNEAENIMWDKTKMKSLVYFYQSINPDFKQETESKYQKLTDYQHVLLILKNMGMNNKQIANAFGVTDSAIRTQLSRINKSCAVTDSTNE